MVPLKPAKPETKKLEDQRVIAAWTQILLLEDSLPLRHLGRHDIKSPLHGRADCHLRANFR